MSNDECEYNNDDDNGTEVKNDETNEETSIESNEENDETTTAALRRSKR